MKYVRETKAAKQIAADLIMRRGEEVARVLAYHGQGSCLVNIFQGSKAAARCYAAAHKTPLADVDAEKAYRAFGFQVGRAGGYGYDKFASAIAGLWIDGHKLNDHCAVRRKPPNGRTTFPRDSKAPKGWHFANYIEKEGEAGWLDCYRVQGLSYLEAIGYSVLRVL
ncbi:MAG: hypothetical protein AB7S41_09055 [Parvibaculaceae bacterium]